MNERTHPLKTPRAAAVAGILFSLLLLTSLVLLLQSIKVRPTDEGDWLTSSLGKVSLALNLIPFAGVAFLWFVGVLRDRFGRYEDRLFATVFLGSGIIFVVLLFASAAAIGAILVTYGAWPQTFPHSPAFTATRSFAYFLTTAYTLKMAGVFLMTASTIVLRTGITARWTAIAGYACALLILLGSTIFDWTFFAFPGWVLAVSLAILFDEYRRPHDRSSPTRQAGGGFDRSE